MADSIKLSDGEFKRIAIQKGYEPVVHGRWIRPHWKNNNYCCNCSECGGKKLKIERKSRLAGWDGLDMRVEMHTFSVRCNTCHARGGVAGGHVMNDPRIRCAQLPDWATTDKILEAKAIEAWNRRTYNG